MSKLLILKVCPGSRDANSSCAVEKVPSRSPDGLGMAMFLSGKAWLSQEIRMHMRLVLKLLL